MYIYRFIWLASFSVIGLAGFQYSPEYLSQYASVLQPALSQETEPQSPPPGCDRTDPPGCPSRQIYL